MKNSFHGNGFILISLLTSFYIYLFPINNSGCTNEIISIYRPGTMNSCSSGGCTDSEIAGQVWCDFNLNDLKEESEHGINGIQVIIHQFQEEQWQVWDETWTTIKPGVPNLYGYWQFCVPPGLYYVEIQMPPAGLVLATPKAGNNTSIDSDFYKTNKTGGAVTEPFEIFPDMDPPFLLAGYSYMAEIGGKVWADSDKDGQFVEGDELFQNVQVVLYDLEGSISGTTYTDESGKYLFDYQRAGAYCLKFIPPDQFSLTYANYGDDESDSDVDEFSGPGMTSYYVVSMNQRIDLDAGLIHNALALMPFNLNGWYGAGKNELEWGFPEYPDLAYFIVERAMEPDLEFNSIGTVYSNEPLLGDPVFHFEDANISNGENYYYRLKYQSSDGIQFFSRVICIEVPRAISTDIFVYPIPTGRELAIAGTFNEGRTEGAILNQYGIPVKSFTLHSMGPNEYREYKILTGDLPNGPYVIQLLTGKRVFHKMILVDTD